MKKTISFLVRSTPDNPDFGYGDYAIVQSEEAIHFGGHASTCPNPYKLNRSGHPIPWRLCFGWVADGEYEWECVEHPKYGKCILVNGGGEVASRNPNPNHDGMLILTEVFIHIGAFKSINPKWRASRGCLTIHPEIWPDFINCFEVGETGKLIIKPFIEKASS